MDVSKLRCPTWCPSWEFLVSTILMEKVFPQSLGSPRELYPVFFCPTNREHICPGHVTQGLNPVTL
jgi:hypothetical protein